VAKTHNFISHSHFTVTVAAELYGKSDLMPWSTNL